MKIGTLSTKIIVIMLAVLLSAAGAATITSLTNAPDPFNNQASSPANIDTVSVNLSGADDLRIGIYTISGTALYRRLYADMLGSSSGSGYWDGREDAIPAYATQDTLAYGTYKIKTWSGVSLTHSATTKGTGIIIDDLWDVSIDKYGYIWCADQNKGVIQRIDTSGNLLTKIDLTASPLNMSGLNISGLAVDDSLNVFFSDRGNTRITKVHAGTNYTTATLTWNKSPVSNPYGLGTDGTRIWLADRGARRVCRFESDGTRTKYFRLNGCTDVALDNNGNYYVTETSGTHQVHVLDTAGDNESYSWVAIASNSQPAGIAIDTVNDYVFVSGYSSSRVYRYNLDGSGGTEMGSGPGSSDGYFDGPSGVGVVAGSGRVVVADRNNNRVQILVSSDGSYHSTINTDASNILHPEGAAIDENGYIYVTSVDLNVVKKFTPAGVYLTTIGEEGSGNGQFSNPRAVEVDASGNVYVSEFGNNRVQRMSRINETTYTYAWQYSITNPGGMDLGPDGFLYVIGITAKSVYILTSGGALVDQITESDMEHNPGGQQVNVVTPSAVAVDYQSNIYVTDYGNGDLFKGTILNGNNQPSSYNWSRIVATNNQLRDVDVDRYGYLYVTVSDDDNAYVYASDGSQIYTWGSTGTGSGQFSEPVGISLTPSENAVWVADKGNNRVQKFTIAFDDNAEELVTIGDPSGPPYVSGVSFLKTEGDSSLTSPISSIHNSTSGDSGVTFVVNFNEAMDTTSGQVPTVTLKDADNNFYDIDPRTGSNFVNGWLKSTKNIWEGWGNIPSGHDGLATVYVENARDDAATTQSPNPDGTNTVILDTESPMPSVTVPANNSSTIESAVSVSGTAEAYAVLTVTIYTASSGGSTVSQESNVEADASGNWSTGSMAVNIGDNYIAAVAVDPAGNTSAATNPRSKVTRANVSPGSIAVSPSGEKYVGDSTRWVFTYTAASALDDNAYVRLAVPSGWTDPQLNSNAQAGYVSVTPGAGTTLDATAVEIVNIDTIKVNITSMSNGTTFGINYGYSSPAGYAKITSSASCGTNTFATSLNDSITVNPVNISVVGKAIGAYYTSTMPETTLVGQSSLEAMTLSFTNTNGLHNKKVSQLSFGIQRNGGVLVPANSRLTALRVKKSGATLGTAVPSSLSSVDVTLSTPLEIAAGDTETVSVYYDAVSNESMAESLLVIALVDSEKVSAYDAPSNTAVGVTSGGGDPYPYATSQSKFIVPASPDSLIVHAIDLMPSNDIGELEKDVPALRLILTHPTVGGDDIEITRIECDSPATPNAVIAKKILRRKGESSNLYSSSTIASSGPLVFSLSLSPLVISGGTSDTIDILFDVLASPTGSTILFSLVAESDVTAREASTENVVSVRPKTGTSFPFSSSRGTVATGTTTPSGKEVDASIADWDSDAERLDTDDGADGFYLTWDNSNLYLVWEGRNLSTSGDLFIYLSTTSSAGATSTWNYNSYGSHYLPSGFGGANYCVYVEDASTKGVRNGASNYSAGTFSGEVSVSGSVTEIRLPLSDIGNPDSLKIIPFVQEEGAADILVSLPSDGVGEFVRNPVGASPQSFISWFKFPSLAMDQDPTAQMQLDSGFVVTPDWVYDVTSDDTVSAITPGWDCLYLSIGGADPRLECIDTTGAYRWDISCSAAPTAIDFYYDITLGQDVIFFGDGTTFRTVADQVESGAEIGSPLDVGATVSTPARAVPPDGDQYGNDGGGYVVYAYFAAGDGKVYKVDARTHAAAAGFPTANVSANPAAGLARSTDRVYAACTNGYVYQFGIDGSTVGSIDAGPLIKNKLWFNSSTATVYAAPNDNNIVSLRSNLSGQRWSLDLGATTNAAPYFSTTPAPHTLYCPAGNYLRKVTVDTTAGTIIWTYQTTSSITTDPVALGSYVYFSSDDKRNFCVNMSTGANKSGWPSAVLEGENQSRLMVNGLFKAVYFGGGIGKLYKYAQQ